jgi:hypothetical protein
MEKQITLSFTNYVIKGVSDVTPWGGGDACIEMDKFTTNSLKTEELLAKVNDGGFGVERINGAICDIYENYEGTLKFLKTKTVGKISEATREFYENEY